MLQSSQSCLQCGAATPNPKFCGLGCAAAWNNVHHPKRKPGRSCDWCAGPARASRKLCDGCEISKKQGKRLFDVETLDGSSKRTLIASVSVGRQTETFFSLDPQPHPASTCGELLEQLLAIVAAEPEYLHATDRNRYAALLLALRDAEVEFLAEARAWKLKAADAPIRLLARVLEAWICSFLEDADHPLMVLFALNLAEFVQWHARGRGSSTRDRLERWRAGRLLEDDVHLGFAHEAFFKRQVTQSVRGTLVAVKVPAQAAVLWGKTEQAVARGGELIICEVHRCHLSDDTLWFAQLSSRDGEAPKYDLGGEFEVPCGVVYELTTDDGGDREPRAVRLPEDGSALDFTTARTLNAWLPARWIVGWLREADQGGGLRLEQGF